MFFLVSLAFVVIFGLGFTFLSWWRSEQRRVGDREKPANKF
jgi:hypothetical protein